VQSSSRAGQNHYTAKVAMRAAGTAELSQFWFPGWSASIDGTPVPTKPTGPSAIVSCEVPSGEYTLEFRYGGLPQRRTGLLITGIFAVLSVLALTFAGWIGQPVKGDA
jgi:hypothetical protein